MHTLVMFVLQLKQCYMQEVEAEQEFIDDLGIGQFVDQQRAADSSQTINKSQSQTTDEPYIIGYRYI